MSDVKYTGYQYKIRAGAPMKEVNSPGSGKFVLHAFMAEKVKVDVYNYTTHLPRSDEFRGQFGDYTSAQFNRLNDRSGGAFSGNVQYNPEYVREDDAISGRVGNF